MATISSEHAGRWSDVATWGSRVPTAGDVVEIGHDVIYDDSTPDLLAGVKILAGGTLTFDPDLTLELKAGRANDLAAPAGNVIVEGNLVMRPANATLSHTLTFANVNEAAFVGAPPSNDPQPMRPCAGGTSEPCDTDVGLWVMGAGRLDAEGASKTSWTRLTGGALANDSVVTVESGAGWRVGDRIVVVPTMAPAVIVPPATVPLTEDFWLGSEERTITAINTCAVGGADCAAVTLDVPLAKAHPEVSSKWRAEVLNLTRNVIVQGQVGKRAHIVFHHFTQPQTLKYMEVRYMGPRPGAEGVRGRYGMHLHMAGNSSRGSLLQGLSLHDLGFRAYVPHASHGVTIRDSLVHNSMDEAFWWDPGAANETHDALWDHVVASQVRDWDGTRLGAFVLGAGQGNKLVNSVAVGVDGTVDSSGFQWPENTINSAWVFNNNVSHNNKTHGIFTWQNGDHVHVVENSTVYRNGDTGIDHGAYGNRYIYRNIDVVGNRLMGVQIPSSSTSTPETVNAQTFENVRIDGENLTQHGFLVPHHVGVALGPTVLRNNTVKNLSTGYALVLGVSNLPSTTQRDWLELQNNDFQVADAAHLYAINGSTWPESDVMVQQWDGAQLALHPATYQATFNEPFNGNSGAWPARWAQQKVVAFGSTATLAANRGQISTPYGPSSLLVFDRYQRARDVQVSATVNVASSTGRAGLVARRADGERETYYKAEVGDASSGGLKILKVVDGVATQLGSSASALTLGVDNLLTFRVSGSQLQAKLGTGPTWDVSVTDTEPRLVGAVGRFGVLASVDSSGAATFDNYSSTVLDPLASIPSSAPQSPPNALGQVFVPSGTPVVDAGPNLSTFLPSATVTLQGKVRKASTPTINAPTLTYAWSKITGPAAVTFSSSASAVTSATFTAAGLYTLRLTATDGALSGVGDVRVVVAPSQSAGPFVETWTGSGAWPPPWTAGQGSGVAVVDIASNQGRTHFGPGSMSAFPGNLNAENISETATIVLSDNAAVGGLFARMLDGDPDTYLAARMGCTAFVQDNVTLYLVVDGQEQVLASRPSLFSRNVAWKLRLSAISNPDGTVHLGVRVWDAAATEDLSQWTLEVPRWSNRIFQGRSGRFGVLAYAGVGGRKVYFDNFQADFPVPATETIFTETWDGTTTGQAWPSPWAHEGSAVSVTNQADKGEIYFTPSAGIVAERVITHSAKDVDITAKLRLTLNNASGGVFALRSDADPGTYLGVTFGTTGWDADAFRIAKFAGSTWTRTDLAKVTSPFLDNSAYYWLRFQVQTNADGSITARAMGWQDGSSPPSTWQLVTPVGWDDSLFRNRVGRFGVLGGPGQAGRRVLFDQFEARFWEVAQ